MKSHAGIHRGCVSVTRAHTPQLACTSARDISAYTLFPLRRTGGGCEEVFEESCFKMPKVSRKVGHSSATESRRINCVFNVRNVGEDGGRSPAWPRLRPQTETRGGKRGFRLFVEVKI